MTELLGTMMRTQDGAQVSFERRYARMPQTCGTP